MKYDVIVCGGGPSGMNAAISARRNGASVLLIEATGLLGGNSVLSLVGPWMTYHNDGRQIVRGIAQEMVERLIKDQLSLGHLSDPLAFCDTITPIDAEGVKALFFDMIDEADIDLLLHAQVMGAIMEESRIRGIRVMTKSGEMSFEADVVIDATGDADVAVHAGAETMHGRQEDGLAQPMTMIFQLGNVDLEVLKDAMRANPEDFVLSDRYDYGYVGISGFFSIVEKAKQDGAFHIPRDRVLLFQETLPGHVSVNMTRVQGLSGVDAFDLTKAEREGRRQIKEAVRFLKTYVPGFEHAYLARTPSKIGVRETRHVIGDHIIDVEDVLAMRSFDDSIALSGFPMDIHSPSGESLELFDQNKDMAFEIPMRSLLPKGIEGMIVSGRCISATHEGAASLRVTPTVMAIGEAAGILAALSAKRGVTPRDVSHTDVQKVLRAQGQVFKREDLYAE
jgi:ribulose 1,5-bisphosphate synthetase/thiazole synthase